MVLRYLVLVCVLFSIHTLALTAIQPVAKAKTLDNLKSAFIGETTASAKYDAYSKKARKEGFIKIAVLFETASKSEKIHANNHKAVLEQLGEKVEQFNPTFEVKSTKENLDDAIAGESYEVATMYPEFLRASNEGGVNLASISFNYAYQTEQKHKVFYKNALDKLNAKKETELAAKYFICSTCGNTYDSQAPKRCGVSMTQGDRFITIN